MTFSTWKRKEVHEDRPELTPHSRVEFRRLRVSLNSENFARRKPRDETRFDKAEIQAELRGDVVSTLKRSKGSSY
eukprot:6177432-Pleurochrysis_carterae.AAC.3